MFSKDYRDEILKKVSDSFDQAEASDAKLNFGIYKSFPRERILKKFTSALDALLKAQEDGVIYNPEYQQVKKDFEGATSGFKALTSIKFRECKTAFYKENNIPDDAPLGSVGDEIFDLSWSDKNTINEVNSLKGKIKKAEKKADPIFKPYIESCKELYEAFQPFVDEYKATKQLVVKGARPKAPEELKPKKVSENALERGTCPCCFSNQARYDGGPMVSHGYQLDKEYGKTSDCAGSRFAPFEESDRGTHHMIEHLEGMIADTEKELSEADDWTTIRVRRYSDQSKKVEITSITADDKDWERSKKDAIYHLNLNIKHYKKDIEFFEEKLDEWQRLYGKKGVEKDAGPSM